MATTNHDNGNPVGEFLERPVGHTPETDRNHSPKIFGFEEQLWHGDKNKHVKHRESNVSNMEDSFSEMNICEPNVIYHKFHVDDGKKLSWNWTIKNFTAHEIGERASVDFR